MLEKYLCVHAYVEAGVLVSREYIFKNARFLSSCKELESVVNPVIKSTGRPEFENGLMAGVPQGVSCPVLSRRFIGGPYVNHPLI